MPNRNTNTRMDEAKNDNLAKNNRALMRAIRSAQKRNLLSEGMCSFQLARSISIASAAYYKELVGDITREERSKRVIAAFNPKDDEDDEDID